MENRERNFRIAAAGFSTIAALVGIRNFDEGFWINIILAAGTVAAAAIVVRWLWLKLEPNERSVWSVFTLALVFWSVVWFWYVDDFYHGYWIIVLSNSAGCALLVTAFYFIDAWRPSLRPYMICFALGLLASCVVFWYLQIRIFTHPGALPDHGIYYVLPVWTLVHGTAIVLIWLLLVRLWKWLAVNWKAYSICFAIAFGLFSIVSIAFLLDPGSSHPSLDNVFLIWPALALVGSIVLFLIWSVILRPLWRFLTWVVNSTVRTGRASTAPTGYAIRVCPNGHNLPVPAGMRGSFTCPICRTSFPLDL